MSRSSPADGAVGKVPFAADDATLRSQPHAWVLTEWRRVMCLTAILAADCCGLALCLGSAWLVRNFVLGRLFAGFSRLYPPTVYLSEVYYFAPWFITFAANHLYTRRFLFWEEARAVVRATTVGTVLAIML